MQGEQPDERLQIHRQQNRRWDTHVENLSPTQMQVNKLIFNHNRSLIFPAGNEYRRMEILDEYVPTMHVESMEYVDEYYHATIMTDEQRTMYLFDKTKMGVTLCATTKIGRTTQKVTTS